MVRAAGGAVWRMVPWGTEVVVVHRPAYGDWTLPKGKREPGESDEACALREVHEETGLRCELGRYVGEVSYHDSRSRPKVVRYWLMQPLAGEFGATAEVDEMRFVGLGEAGSMLSYDHDRHLVSSVASALRRARD